MILKILKLKDTENIKTKIQDDTENIKTKIGEYQN